MEFCLGEILGSLVASIIMKHEWVDYKYMIIVIYIFGGYYMVLYDIILQLLVVHICH